MSYVLHLLVLAICVAIILAFRQSDKNNRSIEKTKRYGEKVKVDFEGFIDKKRNELSDVITELDVKQSRAVAATKKMDEIYDQFNKKTTVIEAKANSIQKIEQYITKSEQRMQKLMDMSSLAERNLTQIAKEANFVDNLAKEINAAKVGLNTISVQIPELQKTFTDNANVKLKNMKEELLNQMQVSISEVEKRIEATKKNSNDLLEVASIKLQDIYKQAYEAAADKANSLEDVAFSKLKQETAERVQKYRSEFEETYTKMHEKMNDGLSETKRITEEFKNEWQTKVVDFANKFKSKITEAETELSSRVELLTQKVHTTEDTLSTRADSLATDLSQTEATIRSQFNALSIGFQEKISSLASFTDKRLSDFKTQTDERFIQFEKSIADVDDLRNEIEKTQDGIKSELLEEISSYAVSIRETQEKFLSEFSNSSDDIRGKMKNIESEIETIKKSAGENVENQLKTFQEGFNADLTKRSEAISLSFDQWKEDISANMALLASENESARKDIEAKYMQDLRTRVAQLAQDYKQQFLRLDEKVSEIANNLDVRLAASDDRIKNYTDKFTNDINILGDKAVKQLDGELASFKIKLADAVSQQNSELEVGAKNIQDRLDSLVEQSDASIDSIKKDFETWKAHTDEQLTEARLRLDDKITSVSELTENSLKNLDAKYDSQYKDFIASTEDSFANLKQQISSIEDKIVSAQNGLDEHASQITLNFDSEAEKVKLAIDKKLREAESGAEHSLQEITDMILHTRTEIDNTQEKMRTKIENEATRLDAILDDITKRQNEFIEHTKVFDRADELKAGLEKDIENIKGEINRFEIYRNAIDNISMQYENLNKLEADATQKMSKFMTESKNIDQLENEFVKLNMLSDSMDKKILELTGANDELQRYQVQIRKIEEGIGDINTRYSRLEKKGEVLDQTLYSIDKAFDTIKDLESKIKNFKNDVTQMPSEIDKIRNTIDVLLMSQGRAEAVCERVETLDSSLNEINEKMDSLKQARSWLAETETRLKEISKNSEDQLKLMSDLFKSEKPMRNANSVVPRSKQDNVLQLSRQGWKEDEIAKALGLSIGEVDLILEFSTSK